MDDLAPPPPPQERKKLTIWLIAGGVASLLLPLLAVIYLRITESRAVPGPSGRNDLFEHRDGSEAKLTPSQPVVIPRSQAASPPPFADARPAAPGGSSLDFIKTNAETRPPASAPPPVAAQAPAPPPEPAVAAKSTSKTAAKGAKKDFAMPKLHATKGFASFTKGGKDAKKGKNAPQDTSTLDPRGAGGGQNMSEMLKNLPPSDENDPRIQEYLKTRK